MVTLTLIGQVLRRIALGLAAAWAVLTVVFLLFTVTHDWVLGARIGGLVWGGADEETVEAAREAYLAERGLDRPLWVQYLDWLGNMAMMDWGESFATGDAVFPVVMEATRRTLMYVVPAFALAVGAGLAIGLWAALRPNGRLAQSSRGTAYLLFALPNFWIGGIFVSYVIHREIAPNPVFIEHVLPVLLLTTSLLGGYVSFSRAYALEHASSDFVKLLRATGSSRLRVARRILHNASIPVVSLVFAEAFALLVLAIFVIEMIFGIEGFGLVFWQALDNRDLPVILGSSMVIIGFGVIGNVIQDLSYGYLDPQVESGVG